MKRYTPRSSSRSRSRSRTRYSQNKTTDSEEESEFHYVNQKAVSNKSKSKHSNNGYDGFDLTDPFKKSQIYVDHHFNDPNYANNNNSNNKNMVHDLKNSFKRAQIKVDEHFPDHYNNKNINHSNQQQVSHQDGGFNPSGYPYIKTREKQKTEAKKNFQRDEPHYVRTVLVKDQETQAEIENVKRKSSPKMRVFTIKKSDKNDNSENKVFYVQRDSASKEAKEIIIKNASISKTSATSIEGSNKVKSPVEKKIMSSSSSINHVPVNKIYRSQEIPQQQTVNVASPLPEAINHNQITQTNEQKQQQQHPQKQSSAKINQILSNQSQLPVSNNIIQQQQTQPQLPNNQQQLVSSPTNNMFTPQPSTNHFIPPQTVLMNNFTHSPVMNSHTPEPNHNSIIPIQSHPVNFSQNILPSHLIQDNQITYEIQNPEILYQEQQKSNIVFIAPNKINNLNETPVLYQQSPRQSFMYVANNNNQNVFYKSVSLKNMPKPNIYTPPQLKQNFVPLNIKATAQNMVPISIGYSSPVTLTPRFAAVNSEKNNIIQQQQPLKMQLYQALPNNKTSLYSSTNTLSPRIAYMQKPSSTGITEIYNGNIEVSNHAPVFVSEPYMPGEVNNTFEPRNPKKNVNAFYYSN